uniref:aldo/keto reductase n=1 Tax=Gluconobacter frateurii TaxID=38308 RepID=UPI00222F3CAB|nr:aldo/keto reductase [Gluconobacter frateurii]
MTKKYGVHPTQIALVWVLKRNKVMLPIPGSYKVAHLEQTSPRPTSHSPMKTSQCWTAEGRKAFQSTQ